MDAERGDPDDVGDVLKMGPAAVEVGDVADCEAERHDRPDERHCAGSPRDPPGDGREDCAEHAAERGQPDQD